VVIETVPTIAAEIPNAAMTATVIKNSFEFIGLAYNTRYIRIIYYNHKYKRLETSNFFLIENDFSFT
jgi:hypothetical protein